MDLSQFNYKELSNSFPIGIPIELLKYAKKQKLTKGRKKFNELFFGGGEIELKEDVQGTWKEDAFYYVKVLRGSFQHPHEDKEAVCALIFEETLIL